VKASQRPCRSPRTRAVTTTSRAAALMQLAMEHGIEEGLLLDFRNFVWWLWKKLGLPDPTIVQYDIAQYLQSGPRRRMIQAFRGVGKSWITAAYVIWRLLRTSTSASSSCPRRRTALTRSASSSSGSSSDIEELQFLRPRATSATRTSRSTSARASRTKRRP
jgi:hypothetical protein